MEYTLITGGAGFIGLNLATELLLSNKNVIIVDDLKNSYVANINRLKNNFKNVLFFKHDVRDFNFMDNLFKTYNIKNVIHLAANKYVDESFKYKQQYFDNNINSLKIILDLSKNHKVNKFVFASTIAVYGNPKECPVNENATLAPLSPYAETKKLGEEIIYNWHKENNKTNVIIFRFSNPVGANTKYMFGDVSKKKKKALIPYVILMAMNNQNIILNGNNHNTPDGTPIRDFVHILDLSKIVIHILNKYNDNKIGLYNVGCGKNGYSVLQVVNQIEKELNKKIDYTFGSKREGDAERFVCDTTKLNTEHNLYTTKSIGEMIQDTIKLLNFVDTK